MKPSGQLYSKNLLTWWDAGVDDVSIQVNGDEKGGVTVAAIVSVTRKKWPLFFAAKGKTERAGSSQNSDVAKNWHANSESGWINGEIFREYLKNLGGHNELHQ
jgi:hypothetical protein